MDLSVLPFTLQIPAGYDFASSSGTPGGAPSSGASSSAATASGAASGPVDVVSIGGNGNGGSFTAVAGDIYRLADLFKGSAPAGQSVAGYRVALGGSGDGQMLLNNVAVAGRTSFTADEFAHLTYQAGADGSQQSLVVVAQTGKRLSDGTLSGVTDSQAVQIGANVTGTRSINAMNALSTTPSGADADADIVAVVKEAGILTGVGSGRPTLSTDGNFTAVAGDIYRLADLFKGSAPTGQSVAGYRVALGGSGDGQMLLNNVPVAGRTSFTADEFAHLTYQAGADASQQSLVVVAQTGKRLADGTLNGVTDSQAVQIGATVTGTRSINAMNALATTPSGADADADIVAVVKEAGILTGVGSGRPSLKTALTPGPATSTATLASATGAYNTTGANSAVAGVDLSPYYPGIVGGSVSPGSFTDPASSLMTALILLDSDGTGAFQSAGSPNRQSEAIKAYNTAAGTA
jgi:hypothetical protein